MIDYKIFLGSVIYYMVLGRSLTIEIGSFVSNKVSNNDVETKSIIYVWIRVRNIQFLSIMSYIVKLWWILY